MGADGPKPAGPEQTDAELANALEVESEDLEIVSRKLIEQEEYELAGYVELLAMDLPEAIRRLRPDGEDRAAAHQEGGDDDG